jgi:mannose-1-phosphate guanylyltransferase/phosphomannomutase
MAGGFGTRLQPLTYQRPKPMVPVAGVPMMEHIVRLLVKYDFDDAISLLYYHGNLINDYFGDGTPWNIRMNYKSAQSDLGTAGSVRNASDLINSSFIVISADVLTDFDLKKAIEFHKDREALATIVLTRHPTPLQFGIVILDEERRITRFLEKPAWGQVFSDTINTGIYILEPEVLEMIPKGELFDFSMNLFPKILSSGKGLYGYIADGYWRDVGNLREYRRANEDALWERVKLHFSGKSVIECLYIQFCFG